VFVLHPHSVSALKSHVDAQAMPLPCALVSEQEERAALYPDEVDNVPRYVSS
jgi:hypothetical protein